ncbi:Major facilitator super domain-containing protein 7 [Chytridiales sp. JEL 0842]|nr:Major facilitator super domain-containing protein 7 [Chytridiales sp. JEL 0842]
MTLKSSPASSATLEHDLAAARETPSSPHPNSAPHTTFTLYKWRYLIALSIFLVNAANSAVWAAYASVTPTSAKYYSTTSERINFLSLVFQIVFIPIAFPAAYFLDTYGLRPALLLGSLGTVVCALVKYLGSIMGPETGRYSIVLVGQVVGAIAQPFIIDGTVVHDNELIGNELLTYLLPAPTKAAALWFGERERLTANTIMSLGQPIGTALALGLSPAIVSGQPSGIPTLNLVLLIVSVVFGLSALFVYNKPETAPSKSAELSKDMRFWDGVKSLVRNTNYIVLFFAFGFLIGCFNTYITLLSDYIVPFGYTEDHAGTIGITTIGVGLASAAAIGLILDRTKSHRFVLKLFTLLTAIGTVSFFFGATSRNTHIALYIGSALIGLGGFPTMPVSLELGVECTYPVPEGTSSGLLWMNAQIWGVILLVASNALRDSGDGNLRRALWLLVGVIFVPVVLAMFYSSENKRIVLEHSEGGMSGAGGLEGEDDVELYEVTRGEMA